MAHNGWHIMTEVEALNAANQILKPTQEQLEIKKRLDELESKNAEEELRLQEIKLAKEREDEDIRRLKEYNDAQKVVAN